MFSAWLLAARFCRTAEAPHPAAACHCTSPCPNKAPPWLTRPLRACDNAIICLQIWRSSVVRLGWAHFTSGMERERSLVCWQDTKDLAISYCCGEPDQCKLQLLQDAYRLKRYPWKPRSLIPALSPMLLFQCYCFWSHFQMFFNLTCSECCTGVTCSATARCMFLNCSWSCIDNRCWLILLGLCHACLWQPANGNAHS